ncbi:MAG: hypothetical protein ACK5LV_01585 [Lachnospirales bacterium]
MTKLIISIITIFFNISMFIFPYQIIEGTKNGLSIWINNVLPVVFPFIVLNNVLQKTFALDILPNFVFKPLSYILGISIQSAKNYLLAIISGYPLGAKLASDLYNSKSITNDEFLKIIRFFNNASPIFILGTVGASFLGNINIGIFLYIVHILSSMIIGILLPTPQTSKTDFKNTSFLHNSNTTSKDSLGNIITSSIIDGFFTTINIGAFIVFFSFVSKTVETSNLLRGFNPLLNIIPKEIFTGLILGILEMTNGIYIISSGSINEFSLAIISFLIGFGGLSITMQSLSFMNVNRKIFTDYIKYKLLHGILASIITLFLIKFFYPLSVQTIKFEPNIRETAIKRYLDTSFIADNLEIHPLLTMFLLSFMFTVLILGSSLKMHKNMKKGL